MTNKISMDKKYEYDGGPASLLCVDGCGKYPVVVLLDHGSTLTFLSDGRPYTGGDVLLIEVKPSKWVNIYEKGYSAIHYSRASADEWAEPQNSSRTRIACIEFKDGDGI